MKNHHKINNLILKSAFIIFLILASFTFVEMARAESELKINDSAPVFKAKLQNGEEFDLQTRKGQWTVLFFYPKAGTPGCTKQACAFRDSINKIRDQGAEVFGISGDTIEDQLKFHQQHKLSFNLIADPDALIISKYGSKLPVFKMSKRWTFIIDSDLKIRAIEKDVDPATDALKVSEQIQKLKSEKP